MIPLNSELGSIGYFGISFNKTEREWNQEDISLLKFTGEILSNAISKSRNEARIIELEKCLSKANNYNSPNNNNLNKH
jgi:GAF domain-containing protein